jgi:hypothetical protein
MRCSRPHLRALLKGVFDGRNGSIDTLGVGNATTLQRDVEVNAHQLQATRNIGSISFECASSSHRADITKRDAWMPRSHL